MRQVEPEDNVATLPEIEFGAIDAAITVERVLQLCDDDRQRHMFSRVYLEEHENSKVAKEMGITRHALNSRLSRTRCLLRKKLAA